MRNALQAFQSVAQLRFWSMQNPFPHIFQLKGAVDAAKKTRIAILEPFWAGHFWCLTVMDLIPDDSFFRIGRKLTIPILRWFFCSTFETPTQAIFIASGATGATKNCLRFQ